jgi:hypothetical protein
MGCGQTSRKERHLAGDFVNVIQFSFFHRVPITLRANFAAFVPESVLCFGGILLVFTRRQRHFY